jgi:hypothetical protein
MMKIAIPDNYRNVGSENGGLVRSDRLVTHEVPERGSHPAYEKASSERHLRPLRRRAYRASDDRLPRDPGDRGWHGWRGGALTAAILGSVDRRHTGSASGLNSAVARTGGMVVLGAAGPALVCALVSFCECIFSDRRWCLGKMNVGSAI